VKREAYGGQLPAKLRVVTSNPAVAAGFRVCKPSSVSKHLAAATALAGCWQGVWG